MSPTKARAPFILTLALLLLLVVISRVFRLDARVTVVTVDEVWSVWQTLGSAGDILRWTPYDWPPLYYLTLGGWRALVGLHPVMLRALSVMLLLIGCAGMYRAGRRLAGEWVGRLAVLAYAANGLYIFLSTELRGYVIPLALMPLAVWWAQRYFERPSLRRAVMLALPMAGMFYSTLTSIIAFVCLGLFTLVMYGRRSWQWLWVGAVAGGIALPEILDKARIAVSRASGTATIQLPPFGEALIDIYRQYAGAAPLVWLGLTSMALVLLAARRRRGTTRRLAALLVWALLPLILYPLNGILGFFNWRYTWPVVIGLALLIGWGLSLLPRAGRWMAGGVIALLMLLPIPLDRYQIPAPPFGVNFAWLAENARPGDVMLIDPQCACGQPEEYDYYARVYTPWLRFAVAPEGHRRVWYVTGAAGPDAATEARVREGRLASIFVGPPEALFRLYEAPPDPVGVAFENGMRFHGIELIEPRIIPVLHEGEAFRFRLWWSADTPLPLDYSVGTFVLDENGGVAAQVDLPPTPVLPAGAPAATSRWQTGEFYVEEREMHLPYPFYRTRLTLALAVYWFGDGVRIEADGTDANGLLPILPMDVMAW